MDAGPNCFRPHPHKKPLVSRGQSDVSSGPSDIRASRLPQRGQLVRLLLNKGRVVCSGQRMRPRTKRISAYDKLKITLIINNLHKSHHYEVSPAADEDQKCPGSGSRSVPGPVRSGSGMRTTYRQVLLTSDLPDLSPTTHRVSPSLPGLEDLEAVPRRLSVSIYVEQNAIEWPRNAKKTLKTNLRLSPARGPGGRLSGVYSAALHRHMGSLSKQVLGGL